MTDILKQNAEIAARFGEVRSRILKSHSVEELFTKWCDGMGEVFAIPFLWVTVIDDEAGAPIKDVLKAANSFYNRLNLVSRELFDSLLAGRRDPLLVSGNIRPYLSLLPRQKYLLRSMAIAPFTLGDEVVGSLNHGDPSPRRYLPEMDTTLLTSFVDSLSRRLTELVYYP